MIGQPPGISGNGGTLTRSLVLLGDGYQHRRLQAAGLIRRGLSNEAISARIGIPMVAVLGVRRQLERTRP